jgi:hypothetical protein
VTLCKIQITKQTLKKTTFTLKNTKQVTWLQYFCSVTGHSPCSLGERKGCQPLRRRLGSTAFVRSRVTRGVRWRNMVYCCFSLHLSVDFGVYGHEWMMTPGAWRREGQVVGWQRLTKTQRNGSTLGSGYAAPALLCSSSVAFARETWDALSLLLLHYPSHRLSTGFALCCLSRGGEGGQVFLTGCCSYGRSDGWSW